VASLKDIILQIVDNTVNVNELESVLVAGHNGPYNDLETPVRNTSHWLIIFSQVYSWTKEKKYRDAALRCATYLTSKVARPYGYSFHHRSGTKDSCNGLIGQAWTFEALAEASRLFSNSQYTDLAEEVFLQHPFDEKTGLWNRLDIDGEILSFDSTFNHQLWFAACISLIEPKKHAVISHQVERFLECLELNLSVIPNGLIYHPIEHLFNNELAKRFGPIRQTKKIIKDGLYCLKNFTLPSLPERATKIKQQIRESLVYKSIGYHSFNMYAFSLLKQQFPEHPFWSSSQMQRMLNYTLSTEFREELHNNKYAYPYNSPGFEIPFSLYVLKDMRGVELRNLTREWTNIAFRKCLNLQTKQFDRNTEDPATLTARLYEMTRLPEEILATVNVDFHKKIEPIE